MTTGKRAAAGRKLKRSIGERGERVKGVGVEQQMGWENGKECDGKKDRQKRTVL